MTLLSRNEMPAALLPPVTLTAMLTHQANDNGRKPEPAVSATAWGHIPRDASAAQRLGLAATDAATGMPF